MPAGIQNSKSGFTTGWQKKGSAATSDKIRLGFIVGKGHDPIPQGTQDRNWPEQLKVMNNTGPNAAGWGGMFQVDVAIGLKVARLHPDLFEIDFITGEEVSPARLASNHLNFNLAYDLVNAHLAGNKAHFARVSSAFQSRSSRLWPEWDLQDWIYDKSRYMKSCVKAGIPTIDTIFVNGFDPARVLKQVQAKGWAKFFVKPAKLGSFGMGLWNGKTQDCLDDPSLLQKFAKEDGSGFSAFLVQPYMLKPNGNVFDEVRNFFIDGEYAYSVYTDGTDDNAVWAQPDGPMLEQCKALATRAYQLLLSKAVWEGKAFVPPITRVDIGVMPDPARKGSFRVFVNEIEMEAATLLGRYCPFNLVDRLGGVYVHKIRDLLRGLEASGAHVPNAKKVKELLAVLDQRLPQKEKVEPPPAKRAKRASGTTPGSQAKRARVGA